MADYKGPPDDFDWPATVFLYIVLILLGGGMCFCLKRANRLIPNRFSFPLTERGQGRVRLAENDEERGLLSEESDAEVIDDGYRYEEDELQSRLMDEEDEFGHLQSSNHDNDHHPS